MVPSPALVAVIVVLLQNAPPPLAVTVEGNALTTTPAVVIQPVDKAYVMFAVPAVMPVTLPEPSTVAAVVLLLLHIPPPVALFNAVTEPAHTEVVPVIDDGKPFTVTVFAAIQPVGSV